ncbi:MAG: AraC family transcriptional regulator [Luteibacter sp.]
MIPADTDRFRRVLDHIDRHLDEDLSLERLATVAVYSRYHFHRRFAALTGLQVHRYVQLSRFKRAAWKAAFRSEVSVTAMALESGYESVEAFSRAFRQRLGQSPSAFRESPDWRVWATAWRELDEARRWLMPQVYSADAVRIVDFPETAVACLSHHGASERIGETIRRFIDWRRAHGLSPAKAATWNVLYDDPDIIPPDAFRMDLCVSCATVERNEVGVVASRLDGGRCAMLRHEGPDTGLADAVRFLYGEWLTGSDELPRDAPLFLRRVRFFPDVAEHEAVTEIYLPLASPR